MWSCKVLGEHSPPALLHSLVYLNTKYLGLHTPEEHLRLSFSSLYAPDHTDPTTQQTSVCIRTPSRAQEHSREYTHTHTHLPYMSVISLTHTLTPAVPVSPIGGAHALILLFPVQAASKKRKRGDEGGAPENDPDDASGSPAHCPLRKEECQLYELYRSKWSVIPPCTYLYPSSYLAILSLPALFFINVQ